MLTPKEQLLVKGFRMPVARFSRQTMCAGVLIVSLVGASADITTQHDDTKATKAISVRAPANPAFPRLLAGLPLPGQLQTHSSRPKVIPSTESRHIPQTGIPAAALAAYRNAERSRAAEQPNCHLSWELLAGIGMVESAHAGAYGLRADGSTGKPVLGPRLTGGKFAKIEDTDVGHWDGDREYDRAVGPLQFLPSTWRAFATDGNGDGIEDLNNIFDAAASAGRYLCAGGGDLNIPTDRTRALLRYNHSQQYVRLVLDWTRAYQDGVAPAAPSIAPVPPLVRRISHQHPLPAPHPVEFRLLEVLAGNTPRDKPGRAQGPDRGNEFKDGGSNAARPGAQAGDLPRISHQTRGKVSEAPASTALADAAQRCTSHHVLTQDRTASAQLQSVSSAQGLASERAAVHASVAPTPDEGAAKSASREDAPPERTVSCARSGCAMEGAPESALQSPREEASLEGLSQCAEQQASDASSSRSAGPAVGGTSGTQDGSTSRDRPAEPEAAPGASRVALP
ncbi:lytic transglycosylase domain-containing protein [Streptomyces netropsis]|uniref:lytic transglycosylase domain-containing protein n=1 Tax=Streptomyces netropsis TaxID=55404 RepID=UPI00379F99A0